MKRAMPGRTRRSIASPARVGRRLAITGAIGLVLSLAACEDGRARLDRAGLESAAAIDVESGAAGERGGAADGLAGVRARADAAFAARKTPPTRRTSRIGVQPWPSDLPAQWPKPARATVLADARRPGERLLLVDLPTSADDAARTFDEALRAGGYAVEHADTRRIRHALHATGRDHEVVLTFTARERTTRIEILFLDPTPS